MKIIDRLKYRLVKMADPTMNPVYDNIRVEEIVTNYESLHWSSEMSRNNAQVSNESRQANSQLRAYKGAVIGLSGLCSLLIVVILLVYFLPRQVQTGEQKVYKTTSAVPTTIPDFTGMFNDLCTIYPCFNGGSCKMNQHQPSCVCGQGSSGDYCEKILYCVNHPCLHGGSCIEDSSKARCECSLGYQGNHCEIDVALTELDITSEVVACKASTEFSSSHPCGNALDGNTRSEWASRGQGVGAWYMLYFGKPKVITQLHVMQRCTHNEQTDKMTVELANNVSQQIKLKCNSYDCEFGLQEFRINPSAKSSFIRITFTHVCRKINNGLAELKVWGY